MESEEHRAIAKELTTSNHPISQRSVCTLLHKEGFSLQANRKTRDGDSHPDRNAQFQHIANKTATAQRNGQPVISIDTKKKELIGNFKNNGAEWSPQGKPLEVHMHDFADIRLGKVIPHGVYDLSRNAGWVTVGIDHDTAEFAVNSIRSWWGEMGRACYGQAKRLVITADCGGSNGYRARLWKVELQRFADETGLIAHVHHFPPGTSKWNKVEHQLFSFITNNWRGRPLVDRVTVVNCIASTTTETGLTVRAKLDEGSYPAGLKVTDAEMASISLCEDAFHGDWNYAIHPRSVR